MPKRIPAGRLNSTSSKNGRSVEEKVLRMRAVRSWVGGSLIGGFWFCRSYCFDAILVPPQEWALRLSYF